MKKHTNARILLAGGLAGGVLFAGSAAAIDWNVTGFVREEFAYGLSSQENPNNQMGNPFNGRLNEMMTFGANLDGIVELVPPNGVYAVAVDAHAGPAGAGRGRALGKGVMNVGVRPTVGGDPSRRVEVHLFDLDRDLYGATLRVHLIARLRAEQKFESLDALKAQIEKDAEAGRAALAPIEARADGAYG